MSFQSLVDNVDGEFTLIYYNEGDDVKLLLVRLVSTSA
jgi:hypothetical protein